MTAMIEVEIAEGVRVKVLAPHHRAGPVQDRTRRLIRVPLTPDPSHEQPPVEAHPHLGRLRPWVWPDALPNVFYSRVEQHNDAAAAIAAAGGAATPEQEAALAEWPAMDALGAGQPWPRPARRGASSGRGAGGRCLQGPDRRCCGPRCATRCARNARRSATCAGSPRRTAFCGSRSPIPRGSRGPSR